MQDILSALEHLRFDKRESEKKAAINFLVENIGDDIQLLALPGDVRSFGNAAIVLKRIGSPRIDKHIPELLVWFQDFNWPGANEVVDLIMSTDFRPLEQHLKKALITATECNDDPWMENLMWAIEKIQSENIME